MSFLTKCKSCSIMVGNGSGVLFQPNTDEYSYIFTAKHNEIELEFNVLGIYEHEILDIAIIKIEKIDIESSLVQAEIPKDQELYKFYGYPKNRRHQDKKIQNFDLIVTDMDSHEIIVRNVEYAEQKDITGCSGGGVFREGKDGLFYLAGIECRMDMESEEEENNTRLRFISIKAFDEVVEKYSDELVYLDESKNFNQQYSVEENVIALGDGKFITIKTVPVEIDGKILNVSIYPVTFEEYDLFCEENRMDKPEDEEWGRDNRPVINISWDNANLYCQWLKKITGINYRLPSLEEWEVVAKLNCPNDNLINYISCRENTKKKTDIVGSKEVGLLGLYDMLGNIYEWSKTKQNESIILKGTSFRNKLNSFVWEKLILVLPFDSNDNLGFRIVV